MVVVCFVAVIVVCTCRYCQLIAVVAVVILRCNKHLKESCHGLVRVFGAGPSQRVFWKF